MNQLAQCQKFPKPISTTFPAFLWKSTIYAKLSEIISKTPTSFRDFCWGMRTPLWSFFLTSQGSIIWAEIPLARHATKPTSISPPQSSEIRAGNWPPKPVVGDRWWWKPILKWMGKKNNKTNSWLEIHHQNDITFSSFFRGIPIYKHIHFVTSILGEE